MKLVKREKSKDLEYRADSLVYKVFLQKTFHARMCFLVNTFLYIFQVFGLYFLQSYVGLFYHAILHRNITTLRQVLFQRLIFSEVQLQNSLGAFVFLSVVMSYYSVYCFQVINNLLENSLPYLKYNFKKLRAVQ